MKKIILSLGLISVMSLPAHAFEPQLPVIKVQSDDTSYRVSVLEEQVRQLNGQIEELTFQLLELQELLRRTQEDNDYRLNDLEDKQGSLGGEEKTQDVVSAEKGDRLGKPLPSKQDETIISLGGNEEDTLVSTNKQSIETTTLDKPTLDGVELKDGTSDSDVTGVENGSQLLGSIQFDKDGNIIDSTLGKPLVLGSKQLAPLGKSLPNEPNSLFDLGYNLIQNGRYEEAEQVLSEFSQQHDAHPRVSEAKFWLGESYLGRNMFREAANVYLDVQQNWPNSKYGPQSLMKLGVSVAGLNQRELACATFAEIKDKYPNASKAVMSSVLIEQKAAHCNVN